MVYAMLIGVGFIVWAHHMYTVGNIIEEHILLPTDYCNSWNKVLVGLQLYGVVLLR
jgi:hypothetical protein